MALSFVLAWPSSAMPPVPHKISGGVEWIDVERREFVVTNTNAHVLLAWREGDRLDRTCLQAGDQIKAYYRKEAGRVVILDFSSSTSCDGCNQETNVVNEERGQQLFAASRSRQQGSP